MMDGYSIRVGVPTGVRDQGFSFTLRTPSRWYYLSAENSFDRDVWISVVTAVLEQPVSPQDNTRIYCFIYIFWFTNLNYIFIFV